MMIKTMSCTLVLLAGLVLAAAGVPAADAPAAKAGNIARANRDLAALVKAAQAEREVVFYSGAPDNITRRVADKFKEKYGITASYLRMPSGTLQQRYSGEAESGNIAADVLFVAGTAVPFAAMSITRGWSQPIPKDLPVITSGEYPERFNRTVTAVIQMAPWYLGYNTIKVKAGEVPKEWPDVLKPQFKGQILLPDPRSSDSYLDFWAFLLDKHGESFLTQLRALQPRLYSSGVPAVQALGAGEGALVMPTVPGLISSIKDKGGPAALVEVQTTTGLEIQVQMTVKDKAKHPNAGRLLANWVMSKEGNGVFNADPGGFTIYDTRRMPRNYYPPKIAGESARRDQIVRLLGLQ